MFIMIVSVLSFFLNSGEGQVPSSAYLGCYATLPRQILIREDPHCLNKKTCSAMCIAKRADLQISFSKGLDCHCANITTFQTMFQTERISDEFCDISCDRAKECYIIPLGQNVCGGNFAYSVLYSTFSGQINFDDYPLFNKSSHPPVRPTQEYKNLSQPDLHFPGLPYRSFDCAQPTQKLKISADRFINYSPQNSPISCSRFCTGVKRDAKEIKYAALASRDNYGRQESYCHCISNATAWKEVDQVNCQEKCKGDMQFICGGTDGKFFTVYDIETPNITDTSTSTTKPWHEPKTETKGDWVTIEKNKLMSSPNLTNADIEKSLETASAKTSEKSYTGEQIPEILDLISTAIRINKTADAKDNFENKTILAVTTLQEIVTQDKKWTEIKENRSDIATKFLDTVDSIGLTSAQAGNCTGVQQTGLDFGDVSNLQVTTGCVLKNLTKNVRFKYPKDADEKQSFIELPNKWATNFTKENISFTGFTVHATFIANIFGSNLESNAPNVPRLINSDMVALNLTSITKFPEEGVIIILKHIAPQDLQNRTRRFIRRKPPKLQKRTFINGTSKCVYWDTTKKIWSEHGCRLRSSNTTVSVCECSHLTAFALLVDVYDYVGQEPGLEILTFVLSPVATVCLVLSIILMIKFSVTMGARNIVTINLCSCLLTGNILVLFLMDRNYFDLSQTFCAISGAAVHYAMLCALCWMAMEGILLYKMVIRVFDSGRDHLVSQHLVGYGLPLVIIGLNYLIGFLTGERPYGGEEFCYLEGNFAFSFIIPLAIVVVGNLCILVKAVRIAYNRGKSTLRQTNKEISLNRCIRGSILISALLGVTWISGFTMLINNYTISTIGAYIFTILNASQGIIIFVFHLKSNEKLWGELKSRVTTIVLIPFKRFETSWYASSSSDYWASGTGTTRGTGEESLGMSTSTN